MYLRSKTTPVIQIWEVSWSCLYLQKQSGCWNFTFTEVIQKWTVNFAYITGYSSICSVSVSSAWTFSQCWWSSKNERSILICNRSTASQKSTEWSIWHISRETWMKNLKRIQSRRFVSLCQKGQKRESLIHSQGYVVDLYSCSNNLTTEFIALARHPNL